MVDPVVALRASDDELRALGPLERARQRMSQGELVEQRAHDRDAADRREVAEARRAAQYQRDRVELSVNGFLQREAEAQHAQAVEARQAEIRGLRLRLAELEGRDGGGWRAPEASDVDRALEAHRAGLAEWNAAGGVCMRARLASAESEDQAAAHQLAFVAGEAQRGGTWSFARGHRRDHPKACTGPVSNYEPGDPRRTDCLANWPPGAGECRCGCGGRDWGRPVSRSRLVDGDW
jgi:hypothetical protein